MTCAKLSPRSFLEAFARCQRPAGLPEKQHADNGKVTAWLAGKQIVLCPLTQLGFLRMSTLPKCGFPMASVRKTLEGFASQFKAERIPDDLPALASHPHVSGRGTDQYLVGLAAKHGFKLATLDVGIRHPAVEMVA